MNTFSVLLSIWGLMVVAFIGLMVYRAHLTQHETDQLFLSDEEGTSSVHRENDEIVRQINSIGPFCKGVGAVAILMTVVVAGTWVAQNVAAAGR